MASITFSLSQFTGDPNQANIILTETETGKIQVTVSVADGYIGDLRGVFFHIGDESLISSLSITGSRVTNTKFGPANLVDDVGNAVISPAKFDVGVELGTEGIGKDDIRSTTFTIASSSRSLTLADFINANTQGSDFGVRITSVGSNREGSSKLEGEILGGGGGDPATPAIDIVKVTNGDDGLTILEGSAITWTYAVSNAGNVGLSNISLTDDKEGVITDFKGDIDGDKVLDVGEIWTYEKTGTAKVGDYNNIGQVTGSYNNQSVTASDPSSYFGANPSINIDKVTNGGDGKTILVGSPITWTYTVTNTGNVGVSNISVADNKEGAIDPLTGGDTDGDKVLDVGETWTYEKTGTAKAGRYDNIGTVTGGFTDDLGNTKPVTDNDPSSYFGADPSINIDKVTNGGDGKTILAGSPITWTYTVTNTGNVGVSNISVTDNKEGAIAH